MKLAGRVLNSSIGMALGELIAPTRCAGCERQGILLCSQCLESLQQSYLQEQACPKCAGPYGALTCTECWETEYSFTAALSLGILDGSLARSIVLYKDANERRLARLLGTLLAKCIQDNWGTWAEAACWIPSTKEALKRRGFDHGELLACSSAHLLNLPSISLLVRQKQLDNHDQRGLSRKQRKEVSLQFTCIMDKINAKDYTSASTQNHYSPLPRKILLIDDVFTTGATAEAATQALLKAGAQEVRVATLGRAW
ncbi:MAG: hypothetical protein FWE48_03950 [Coriobacteriia bacterium]|nr:hypothetical protein [Coriobacteriia bacterium]MCL2870307.1 hypothetical protein [Coriobacteriia bacterium]